ncbi:MAG: glycosyltransferase family 2 protein [Gammaproteobacteria bacterium]|nr:glycosyltransferase family 2 protein [Gammaproteobacteria bacterium]
MTDATPDFDGRLSVVVPVRDERENVATLVAEIHEALAGLADLEVLYVDDGSRDGTAEALGEACARYPRLRVLRHAEACGQSAALRSGVRAARFPWVATLDGDGQNDPRDLPALLALVSPARRAPGLELVAGNRVTRRDTWLRRLSSRVANGVRSWLLGDHTPDTGCGLKVFGRDFFLSLPYFDHVHRFLPALALREGGGVLSVPVSHRPRAAGSSKYGVSNRLWVGIVDLLGVAWLQRRMRRPVLARPPGGKEGTPGP